MFETTATIRNTMGIHCRPSAEIVKAVRNYRGRIRVWNDDGECDPRSVVGLLSMALQEGARVRIAVEGEDEAETARMLAELFERQFDFPPLDP
jgi:phosphocarrier protein